MKRFLAGLLFAAISPVSTLAQKVTVVRATEQRWNGGIAGHHGTDYRIDIKVNAQIAIDSLYINGNGFVPEVTLTGKGNLGGDSAERTYAISADEFHDDMINGNKRRNSGNTTSLPFWTYKGKALIVYKYKGEKHLYSAKEMTLLTTLNYP